MSYIVAHPGALVECDFIEQARERADFFRESRIVKIYKVEEVEIWFPRVPAAPSPETKKDA